MSTAKYSDNSNETVNSGQKTGTAFQMKDNLIIE
jgi:hypothetical protein